jgi:uncharacterized delta-60 repeat protein
MNRLALSAALLAPVLGAMSCGRVYLAQSQRTPDSGSPQSTPYESGVPIDGGPFVSGGGADAPDTPATCTATIDPTFGQQGWADIPWGVPFEIAAVFAQADGRLVAVGPGWSSTADASGSPTVFVATRLLTNGQPDPTFGVDGTATAPIPSNGRVSGGALQSDGKVIVLGSTTPSGGPDQGLVTRFSADGSLDTGFGSAGVAPVPLNGALPVTAAIAADGSILVGGQLTESEYSRRGNVILAKYDPQGRLDPTFGSGGLVRTSVGIGDDEVIRLLVQPDGRIVVGGDAFVADADGGSSQLGMLLRYTPAGVLDSTFGANGIVLADRDPFLRGLALESDGKLVVSLLGRASNANFDELVAARYTATGALDPTFGSSGVATFDCPRADAATGVCEAWAVFLLRDGSMVLPLGDYIGWLARLGPTGVLDTAFGNGGFVLMGDPVAPPGQESRTFSVGPPAAAVTSDGKLIVAGGGGYGFMSKQHYLPMIARYCL